MPDILPLSLFILNVINNIAILQTNEKHSFCHRVFIQINKNFALACFFRVERGHFKAQQRTLRNNVKVSR